MFFYNNQKISIILQFLRKLQVDKKGVFNMNWKFWNRRYYTASGYTLVVILISITYWKSFEHGHTFTIMQHLWPFIIGLSLAYILNFLLRLYERKIKHRSVSLALVYSTIIILIFAFLFFLAPKVSDAMEYFIEEFPDYSEQIIARVETYLTNFDITEGHVAEIGETMTDVIDRFVTFNQNLVPRIMEHLVIIRQTLTNITLGIVLSLYILAKKETLQRQFKLILTATAGKEKKQIFMKWAKRADEIFTRFFAGMALNSLIVGILTTVMLFIFQIPFAILIGFIVAVTNIIPIFGPFIGAIPSAIMIFFVSPTKALIFTIIILIIQQIDSNIITPKILGDKIGIAPVWVLASILIFGYFFGLIGTVIGVPITALIIEITRTIVYSKLDKKTYKTESTET